MAVLLSVNVGMPRDVAWRGKTVHTAIWKQPVMDRRRVRRLDIDGDAQGDLSSHGGEQRAVLVYQIESYRYWQQQFHRSDFVFGQFGENLTVAGLPDDEVCIGDRYRIGTALFEVTQPRVTCYRVGIRMGEPRMAALLVAHHRPGFYMRVLEEGEIGAGDAITLEARGPEAMTVVEADALVYLPGRKPEALARALKIDAFSPGWKVAFHTMAEQLRGKGWDEGKGIILNSGAKAAWSGFQPLRVTAVRPLTDTVLALELSAPDGGAKLSPAIAGQFITLQLPQPGSDVPILRSYSLTDASAPGRYPIAVKREAHGRAGAWLAEHAHVGGVLQAAAPRGGFQLRNGSQAVVLLSAGIGVTPLLAMLRALVAARTTRPVYWIHGARNGRERAFAAETATLLAALPHAHRLIAYSRPLPEDHAGTDYDVAGRLDLARLHAFGIPRDADVYLCGPEAFMRDLQAALAAIPIPPLHVRTEHFAPTEAYAPGVIETVHHVPHLPAGPEGTGPRVTFARSGISVRWDDRYHSLLELAEACDVNVRFACRTGVCHTCITRKLRGSVAYGPEPLERPDADNVLICCSHPTADIDLDL